MCIRDRRWSAWGTAYGGSDKTNGDPAVGSNTFTANTYGFAAGMDYHPAPDAILEMCIRDRRMMVSTCSSV